MSSSKRYSPIQTSYVYPLQSLDDEFNQSSLPSCEAATARQENSSPKVLGKWGFNQWATFSGDIILAIFPILFIGKFCTKTFLVVTNVILKFTLALAAIAISLDKKPTSALGHNVESAISLSPTIFPIVFAAITGKFFKTLGLFWAERGITLGV